MKYNTGGNPIWHQYATDIGWAEKQIKQIDRVMELARNIDDVVLDLIYLSISKSLKLNKEVSSVF